MRIDNPYLVGKMFKNVSPDSVNSGPVWQICVRYCPVRKLICPVRLSPINMMYCFISVTSNCIEIFMNPNHFLYIYIILIDYVVAKHFLKSNLYPHFRFSIQLGILYTLYMKKINFQMFQMLGWLIRKPLWCGTNCWENA